MGRVFGYARSVTGYVFFFAGGPISWRSRRQRSVALSSTEAEYIAASDAAREVVWLRRLFSEMMFIKLEKPTVVYEDNQGAIALTLNDQDHERSKHISLRAHFIREKVQEMELMLLYVNTSLNIADVFTKATDAETFKKFRDILLRGTVVRDR
jgi:hypothetical protein